MIPSVIARSVSDEAILDFKLPVPNTQYFSCAAFGRLFLCVLPDEKVLEMRHE